MQLSVRTIYVSESVDLLIFDFFNVKKPFMYPLSC